MLTQILAEQALSYRFDRLPPDVVRFAKLAILDNLGCALRGSQEPVVTILAKEFLGRALSPDDLIPGQLANAASAARPTETAMLHAVAAHAIDFDDTHPTSGQVAVHIGSPVIGALFALAPSLQTSGKALIAAVVAGYETAVRVGMLLDGEHYLKGFHPTSTVGIFGVVAACANLIGLTVSETRAALGLAATQASGLKCTFGTMAKPFNAGHAAASGLLATKLAAGGFTAPLSALEEEQGYLGLFSGLPPELRTIATPDQYFILNNLFKFHAACHATHPMIDGINQLKRDHHFAEADVEQLTVQVGPLARKTANITMPKSGLDCKFSFPQIAAFTLAGHDTAAESTYDDTSINDARISALRARIHVANNPTLAFFETDLICRLTDGRVLELHYDYLTKMKQIDTIEPLLLQKFASNGATMVDRATIDTLCQTIQALDMDAPNKDEAVDFISH